MTACHTLSYCYFQLQWEAATSYTTVTATCYDSLPHPQLLLLPVAMKGRHLYSTYCYCHMLWKPATPSATVTSSCNEWPPPPPLLLLPHAMTACHTLNYCYFQLQWMAATYSTYCYCHMLWKPATFSAISTFNEALHPWLSMTRTTVQWISDTSFASVKAQCNESPRSPALFSLSRAMKACLVLCQNRDCQVKWKPAASFATLTKLKACHLLPLGKSDIHFFLRQHYYGYKDYRWRYSCTASRGAAPSQYTDVTPAKVQKRRYSCPAKRDTPVTDLSDGALVCGWN